MKPLISDTRPLTATRLNTVEAQSSEQERYKMEKTRGHPPAVDIKAKTEQTTRGTPFGPRSPNRTNKTTQSGAGN